MDVINSRPNIVSIERAVVWGGEEREYAGGVTIHGESLYVTASTASYGSGKEDIFLLKYDVDGSLLENRTWGGFCKDVARSVVAEVDSIYVNDIMFGTGHDGQAYLLKYSSNKSMEPRMAALVSAAPIVVALVLWMAIVLEAITC